MQLFIEVVLVGAAVTVAMLAWFHLTNPYARRSVVRRPYVTTAKNGRIAIEKQFDLRVYSGRLARLIGYAKSGFLIVQNAWFGSYPAPSRDADGIIADIHALRFDPSKPYLISGDQFSVLYPRNLGVFYNTLLDHRTAHSQQDWENRQRIYLQSALYALDAFSAARGITTTIVPIGPQSVVLTQVHPGSVASDSLYGLLYAFDQLQTAKNVQTAPAVQKILSERMTDFKMLLDIYEHDVRDPAARLVKRGVHLASARDGALRDSSFYDNVVLWKTLALADKLGIKKLPPGELDWLKNRIIDLFWNEKSGYFKDDQKSDTYSSDWLLALPTGFLSVDAPDDIAKIKRIVDYTKAHKIDRPFPIRYTMTNDDVEAPWAVKTFVPNYGGDAIWSYWGAQYIWLLAEMYRVTRDETYKTDAQEYVRIYRDKIEQTRGFPETFRSDGEFLQNAVYKSIRQTGWVVQFEAAQALLDANTN